LSGSQRRRLTAVGRTHHAPALGAGACLSLLPVNADLVGAVEVAALMSAIKTKGQQPQHLRRPDCGLSARRWEAT